MSYPWHYYVMIIFYLFAGIMHFGNPRLYLRVMPRYLPYPKLLVYLSGAIEVLLGIGLFLADYRVYSIYGIVFILFLFLLVHFYMLSSKKAAAGFPKWVLILRIPLQFVLMYWAYSYLKF